MKSQPTKNTLLKNAQAKAKAIFLREYFFSHPKRNSNFFSPTLRCFNFFCQRTLLTRTDIASNVNRFGQSVCKLDTTHLRTNRMAAGNRVARPAAKLLQGEALTFINRNEMQVDHRTHSALLRAGKRLTHTAARKANTNCSFRQLLFRRNLSKR